jgi:hypothetical protein
MFSLATVFRFAPRTQPARAFVSSAVVRAPPSAPVDDLISALDSTQERLTDDLLPGTESMVAAFQLVPPLTPQLSHRAMESSKYAQDRTF